MQALSPVIERLHRVMRSSVGTAIYMSIAAIAALTIAASVIAFVSFTRVGGVITSLTDDRYPVVELSRDLAQTVAEAVALAPRLSSVTAEKDLTALMARLNAAEERSRGIVAQLVKRGAADPKRLVPLIDKLHAEIVSADQVVRQRLEFESEKSKSAAQLTKIGEAFSAELISEIDNSQFNLVLGFEKAAKSDSVDDIKKMVAGLADKDLVEYGADLTLLSEGHQLYGLMREVLVLDRVEMLVPALDRYKALIKRVQKALKDGEKVRPDKKRKTVTEALLSFGTGEKDVFVMRRDDFDTRKTIVEGIESTGKIASTLYAEVDKMVVAARTAAGEGAVSAKTAIANGSLWLIGIVFVSVLAAGCIAYFYVRPQIVRRLQRLSEATRQIAEGALDTDVGVHGTDEIGAVASAVVIFRDAAIEKLRLEGLTAEQRKQADLEHQRAEEQRQQAEEQRLQADAERRRADEERLRNEEERRKSAEAQARAAVEQAAAIKALAEGLARVSAGDLTFRLDDGFSATYSQIKDNFNATIGQLQETIKAIVDATREITNASAEIAASTTDLSQRTEEQAASLEQTSASMEQIATTVKNNAENAQIATKSAGETRDVAERGGAVVGDAVKAMARIEESSHKISDIIGVIDEIARQTNLLALNAAVEAARAGDAGRGFAVVASEVRSLAQRSSQAAKDIKDLITNSNGLVKDGVQLVNRAGASLNEIVESIKKVVGIVSGIAEASTEQATGIEHVNKALVQMDDVTQHNSALVEENAATAKTLESQAKAMDERVSFFRISDAAPVANPQSHGESVAAARPEPAAASVAKLAAAKPAVAAAPAARMNGSGGPARRMQTQLATALKEDPDWQEF